MNLKQFRYVLTVAKEQSFSEAADVLRISQPSLSQYIKNIENQLGISLFERNNRGNVRLTDAGLVYVETGRRVLDLEHQMESRLDDIKGCRMGTVRIGISAHRGACLLPPIAAAFKKTYPGYEMIVDERSRRALIDAAEHGEFDLCITTLPVNTDIFCVETLFKEEMVLAVPKESVLYKKIDNTKEKIDLTEVYGEDFVVLSEEHPMQYELEQIIKKNDLSINSVIECTSLETMISMVSAGMGMALVPACMKNYFTNNIKFFSIDQEMPKRDIVVIYRKEQYISKTIKELIELMKKMLNQMYS